MIFGFFLTLDSIIGLRFVFGHYEHEYHRTNSRFGHCWGGGGYLFVYFGFEMYFNWFTKSGCVSMKENWMTWRCCHIDNLQPCPTMKLTAIMLAESAGFFCFD